MAHSRHTWVAGNAGNVDASGDHGGARVVTGKSAVRIPAPERHDELTVAATKEREVKSLIDHGSA